jgi:hypothetical protein
VQVVVADVVEVEAPDGADAERAHPLARGLQVVELEHDHVAAVAAAALEVPAGGRPVLLRRDDLDERVAERHHRVAQAEVRDAGIVERVAEAELLAQRARDGVEVTGDEDGLTEADHRRA